MQQTNPSIKSGSRIYCTDRKNITKRLDKNKLYDNIILRDKRE